MTTASETTMSKTTASRTPVTTRGTVVHEYVPLDEGSVHGVTFDGKLVWFARNDELVAFDPGTKSVVKRFSLPKAGAGTAFDGTHLYQLAGPEILVVDPADGRVVRKLPSPATGQNSGMAYADGHLWVGQYRDAKILKIDAKTGELVKTLTSDRFVTGVSFADGALWHGVSGDDSPPELRRLAPDGTVEEVVKVDAPMISGVESDGKGGFFCGGEKGRLRLVKAAS
ncbi:MAG: glutaminyl-peptide cyclotransferase [Polyangiaceae bacterium]